MDLESGLAWISLDFGLAWMNLDGSGLDEPGWVHRIWMGPQNLLDIVAVENLTVSTEAAAKVLQILFLKSGKNYLK